MMKVKIAIEREGVGRQELKPVELRGKVSRVSPCKCLKVNLLGKAETTVTEVVGQVTGQTA